MLVDSASQQGSMPNSHRARVDVANSCSVSVVLGLHDCGSGIPLNVASITSCLPLRSKVTRRLSALCFVTPPSTSSPQQRSSKVLQLVGIGRIVRWEKSLALC